MFCECHTLTLKVAEAELSRAADYISIIQNDFFILKHTCRPLVINLFYGRCSIELTQSNPSTSFFSFSFFQFIIYLNIHL